MSQRVVRNISVITLSTLFFFFIAPSHIPCQLQMLSLFILAILTTVIVTGVALLTAK